VNLNPPVESVFKFKFVYCYSFIYTVYKNNMGFITDQGANTKEKTYKNAT